MAFEEKKKGQWSLCLASHMSLVGSFSPVLKQQKLEEKRGVFFCPTTREMFFVARGNKPTWPSH